ncbi:macrocin o-methyltransferase [Tupanvirus deep ocean]|uniref:Macrocin o-methyltransferase n=2 Tax=Tupanvirus TaxID=2094720 RepID=A0AC62A6Q3_9VIRU|nr:macrocin o-methyltransferase [Tupanvirus deep ocean]QKU33460.1 macrocin o-methyltransferase [Tupanvirus deep ocean]
MTYNIYMLLIYIILGIILLLVMYCFFRKWYYFIYLKNQIFPFEISDIKLEKDITKEPNYYRIMDVAPRKLILSEIVFLLKYKKFVDLPNVYSMCDTNKINQTKYLLENIIKNGIAGAIVETGVWKGGMGMWMKCIIKYHNDSRDIWLFDTFSYFPNSQYPTDAGIHNITNILFENMPTPEDVKYNFKKMGLLDDKIHIVPGKFNNTLPFVDPGEIAILRLDSDYYDSTLYVLELYYWKITSGGCVIVDDYNNIHVGCKKAIDDFRSKYNITNPIYDVHNESIYWIIA